MTISSLNSNLYSQISGLSGTNTSTPSLQNLAAALSSGDQESAKSIFSALTENSASQNSDPASQSLMGQLGLAIDGGNVSKAQQITSALQTLQTQEVTDNPLLDNTSSSSTGNGLNDSLFNALSLTGVTADSATSLAGTFSSSQIASQSPAQQIAQNIDSFLNNLLTTLQANNSSTQSASSSVGAGGMSVNQNPYSSGSPNQLSSGLQSLIQQLAKNPGAASELNTSEGNANSSFNSDQVSNPQINELQASYDKLINSQGGSSGSSSLIAFLQNFEGNMKNMQSAGGLLNIQA